MILKTRRSGKDNGWYFVDGIINLRYCIRQYKEVKGLGTNYRDLENIDDENGVLIVIFTVGDDSEQVYILSEPTYILGDSGKTIEKIF
jgi:hypothetical protein